MTHDMHEHVKRGRLATGILVVGLLLLGVTRSAGAANTVDRQISATSDDAMEDGSPTLTDDKLEFGAKPWFGVRFTNVAIEQGAIITSAYLEFKANDSTSGDTDITIYGEDADDPGTFTSASSNVSGRTRTTASCVYNNMPAWTSGNWYQTPSLVSVVQEIVDRPGFASSNAMVFIIKSNHTNGDKRICRTRDFSAADAPKLHLEALMLTVADHAAGQETDAFSQSDG
ncbi:MAG: hypothetical protein GY715_11285 [Planctomycetes bacterium]|nr:hypothetical protein [Planctomycetota bacterium]